MTSASPANVRIYGGQSADERRQVRRERLLDAGLKLFGTVGVKDTSMRGVLTEAGLGERYFYESFPDVMSLFMAVYERCVDRVLTATVAAVSEVAGNPSAEIRAGVRAFFEATAADPLETRVMLIEAVASGPELFEQALTKLDLFTAFIAQRVTATGAPAPTAPRLRLIGSSLVGAMDQLQREYLFGGLDIPLDEVVEYAITVFDMMLEGLLAGRI